MDAPQSGPDVQEVVEGLQRLDPLLDVRWNPKAIARHSGRFDAQGRPVPPRYEGRWEVIRYETPTALDPNRPFVRICTVCERTMLNGVPAMQADGPYAPLGMWLVEFLQAADAANSRQAAEIRRRLDAHDAHVERTAEAMDEGGALDALDKLHFAGNYVGGVGNWQGKGADFRAMEAAARARAGGAKAPATAPAIPGAA